MTGRELERARVVNTASKQAPTEAVVLDYRHQNNKVAVGSNLSKLFCTILHQRLLNFSNQHNLIPQNQIGYKKQARTTDHILTLKCIIDKYIFSTNRKYLFSCFVDFKSAFDTVWRKALIYKLLKLEIGGSFIATLESMYSDVSYCIKLNSQTTDKVTSNTGVKQGCVLSPVIFNLFLADLPATFDDSCHPVENFNSKLNCLMFADDIVLLSESAEGLQNSLNKLNIYCKKWKLTLNTDKTKVIIFNRGGHQIKKFRFTYNSNEIQITQKYCYLGILFTSSGLFTEAIKSLSEKASKAFYMLRKLNTRDNTKLTLKLFDSLVSPILHYSCEVWAPFLFKKFKNDNFLSICDTAPIENLNIKLCKYILGVGKKSTNLAVKGELGRSPLLIKATQLSVKFWHRLNILDTNTFVKKSYLDDIIMNHKNYSGWSHCIYNIMNNFGMGDIWENQADPDLTANHFFTHQMYNLYKEQWLKAVKYSSKLKNYAKFKVDFNIENYLLFMPTKSRRNFTKFRISNHNLSIETGRYTNPKTPPEHRMCLFCLNNCVEDEFHFLLNCPFYTVERESLLDKLKFLDINDFECEESFVSLMSSTDYDVCTILCKYVQDCYEKRNSFIVKEGGCYRTSPDLLFYVESSRLSHIII